MPTFTLLTYHCELYLIKINKLHLTNKTTLLYTIVY